MNDIYVLLGDDANKEQIDVIYKIYSDRILERIKKYDSSIKEIPNELNFILTEVTIERYQSFGYANKQNCNYCIGQRNY